jgi:hypothetical protein
MKQITMLYYTLSKPSLSIRHTFIQHATLKKTICVVGYEVQQFGSNCIDSITDIIISRTL